MIEKIVSTMVKEIKHAKYFSISVDLSIVMITFHSLLDICLENAIGGLQQSHPFLCGTESLSHDNTYNFKMSFKKQLKYCFTQTLAF